MSSVVVSTACAAPATTTAAAAGTGIVHCAPAFGEDDYRVCIEQK